MLWFHAIDVYDNHFSDTGITVLIYNCARIAFIFYLFWMIETVGLATLRVTASKAMAEIGWLDRLVLGFFTGVCIWHVVLLSLGYLDLYSVPVAIIITLPIVAASFGDLRSALCQIKRSANEQGAFTRHLGAGPLGWLVAVGAAAALVTLLLVKGLYPGGGHDYYTHYFYYFMTVIRSHGLWPNNVWYHYYYDKGAGLYFLGILLTDPLAPQLVTFTLFAAAALALYLMLRRIAPDTLWPLVGVLQFISIYIYTPGSAFIYWGNGGWGEFEKTHEIIAALVVAAFWMTVEALSSAGRIRRLWLIGGSVTIISAIIVDVIIGVFFGGLFALLTLYYLTLRHLDKTAVCAAFGAAAAFSVIATLIVNQWTTGLADDQGILLFWRFANVAKLAQWGALPLVIELVHDRQSMVSESFPLVSRDSIVFFVQSFRLDLIWPMLVGGVLVAMPSLLRRRWNRAISTPLVVVMAAAVSLATIALIAGRFQQVSFYRYASFTTALAIMAGIVAWNLAHAEDLSAKLARSRALAVTMMAVCALAYGYPRATFHAAYRAMHFAVGAYSIDTAYQTEGGLPSSAIHAGARGAYEAIGPGIPIWSFFNHAYCMLPRCLIEEYPGFIASPDWYRIMSQEAKQALQLAGLNYFLFTREDNITDPLPLSALFNPANIGHSLGIRWTDGTSTLLTWLGPNVTPLDPAWIADYSSLVKRSPTVAAYPYTVMKNMLNVKPRPSGSNAPH